MPCFKKRVMYPTAEGGRWTFDSGQAKAGADGVEVGCGKCQGCMVRRTGEWVLRNAWEFSAAEKLGCFVTLTYANEHLPDSYSVEVRDLQLFLKRLRKRLARQGVKVRFFAVAEYGEDESKTLRPHYHVLLYGWMPGDLVAEEKSQRGLPQWSSEFLTETWGKGRVVVGEVTHQSISYVAGYVFDKRYGDNAKREYSNRLHPVSGEIVPQVRAPFNVMSRKPGIGAQWFKDWEASDAKSSFAILDGRKRAMPRSVVRQRLAAMASDEEREAFKEALRVEAAAAKAAHAADNTQSRLLVREVAQVLKAAALARGAGEWPAARIEDQLEAAGRWAERERQRAADGGVQAHAEKVASARARMRRQHVNDKGWSAPKKRETHHG